MVMNIRQKKINYQTGLKNFKPPKIEPQHIHGACSCQTSHLDLAPCNWQQQAVYNAVLFIIALFLVITSIYPIEGSSGKLC